MTIKNNALQHQSIIDKLWLDTHNLFKSKNKGRVTYEYLIRNNILLNVVNTGNIWIIRSLKTYKIDLKQFQYFSCNYHNPLSRNTVDHRVIKSKSEDLNAAIETSNIFWFTFFMLQETLLL